MRSLMLCGVLALLTICSITLHKAYTHIPRRELKRRAQSGDNLAGLLYRAAAYGPSLEVLLWLFIGLFATGFFVELSRTVPGWLAMIGSLCLLWLGFAWLPFTRLSNSSMTMARLAAAPLAWVLQKIFPLINWFVGVTGKWRLGVHTGIYEKEDLIELLGRQSAQVDSRLSADELRLAKNALTFGDKLVREIMLPRGKAQMVSADDTLGPILMNELHASGQTSFPVYQGKKSGKIVGTLYLRDVVSGKVGGAVQLAMRPKVYYLHDEMPLDQALQAFLRSKHHLFVVVNSFEEVVGVVSIDDIMSEIVGQPIDDDFDHYDDPVTVAKRPRRSLKQPTSEKDQTVVESD